MESRQVIADNQSNEYNHPSSPSAPQVRDRERGRDGVRDRDVEAEAGEGGEWDAGQRGSLPAVADARAVSITGIGYIGVY